MHWQFVRAVVGHTDPFVQGDHLKVQRVSTKKADFYILVLRKSLQKSDSGIYLAFQNLDYFRSAG